MPIVTILGLAFVMLSVITTVSLDAWSHARGVQHARKTAGAVRVESLALDALRAAIGPQIAAGVAPGAVTLPGPTVAVPLCAAGVTACPANVAFAFTDQGRTSAGVGANPAETAANVQSDPGVGEAYADVLVTETFTDAAGNVTGARREVPMKLRLYTGSPYATPVGTSDTGQNASTSQGQSTGCAGGGCGDDTRIHAYVQCDDATYVLCAQRWTETGGFGTPAYSSAALLAPVASK